MIDTNDRYYIFELKKKKIDVSRTNKLFYKQLLSLLFIYAKRYKKGLFLKKTIE